MWIKSKEGLFNTKQLSAIYEGKDGSTQVTDCSERRIIFISENNVLEEIVEGLKFHKEYLEVE